MNDSIFVYKIYVYSDYNKTYEYDLMIRSGMTLSEFVYAVLEDKDECGNHRSPNKRLAYR